MLLFRTRAPFMQWSLLQRFNVAGAAITLLGTLMIGWWVGREIKTSIINESAAATALYLDSFITPNLQQLEQSDTLSAEHAAMLESLLNKTDLGQQIVTIKVWDRNMTILYSNHPSLVGKTFPAEDLVEAWSGHVVANISNLSDEEHAEERKLYQRLLEIYVPIRQTGTHKIIAIAEFYQTADTIEAEIAQAQRQSWLAIGSGMGIVYLALALFFRWTRNQIRRREIALRNQVAQLKELIAQNDELDLRVRRARANAATLNERILLRLSAELDRQATQKINTSLTFLHDFVEVSGACPLANQNNPCNENLPIIQSSLETAVKEIVSIASGLGLPHLEEMALREVFTSAVLAHEQRTGTQVAFHAGDLPEDAPLPVKITAYRIVQEGLNNAFRHARGLGQQVQVAFEAARLQIEISDRGPGFDTTLPLHKRERLGLAGMRERVESLGGKFTVESSRQEGTKIVAVLPLALLTEGEIANV